jgi:hypothetical protein
MLPKIQNIIRFLLPKMKKVKISLSGAVLYCQSPLVDLLMQECTFSWFYFGVKK